MLKRLNGEKIGEILWDAWNTLPRGDYHLIIQEALRRVPLKNDSRHGPLNLLAVNRAAVRVYQEYRAGKLEIFEGETRRLVRKGVREYAS